MGVEFFFFFFKRGSIRGKNKPKEGKSQSVGLIGKRRKNKIGFVRACEAVGV